MRVVIIEDELYAAKRLQNLIKQYDEKIEIAAWLESVSDSIEWFRNNPEPDLIFLDIHLEDNLSFAIFEKVNVSSPLIFTTATDDVAIKAFITRGIDYLHKPIVQFELFAMMEKYRIGGDKFRKNIGPDFFRDIINTNS